MGHRARRMRILFLASEVVPFSKTGGLADVSGALPAALAALGHEVLVATPLYGKVPREGIRHSGRTLELRFPFGHEPAELHLAELSENHRVMFIGNARFFERPEPYGNERGDYPDNHLRFGFFGVAALSGAMDLGFVPDIVHLNDWQTGPAAVALRTGYAQGPLAGAKSVFTIHNMAYQGFFSRHAMGELGLPESLFHPGGLEFHGNLNFMKAGLLFSDALTTVSPRYAYEVQTPEGGWGLDGVLRARSADLHGIINGVDTTEWNPAKDVHLPARYDARDLSGKSFCKRALLDRFGLEPGEGRTQVPLLGIVSRMVSQKGFDILIPALPYALDRGARLVVLGSGEQHYQHGFRELAARYPGRVGLQFGYDVALSHLIEAGSDFFLMPSLYEPCGLNQMYSLLYGTVPIVRAVGGLDDTVRDLAEPGGTGIKFGAFDVGALVQALQRALTLFADPKALREVRRRGMKQDFSWDRSARDYAALYEQLLGGHDLPAVRKAK
jgi:starch synthase